MKLRGLNRFGLLKSSRGFTLMEVLVATAITAVAIGVTLSLFAQGHSQAFRGQKASNAAEIASRLIDTWRVTKKYPREEEGEVEFVPGWRYSVRSKEARAQITLPSGEKVLIEPKGVTEIVLEIIPPDRKSNFVLTFMVSNKMVANP